MLAIDEIEQSYRKPALPRVQSGDTVRVHQLIREGNKQRVQVFEGVVIRTRRSSALSANLTVRRIASGVGVEKTFLLHSPNLSKIEVIRRSKVRRNFLSYLRERKGKSARLQEVGFDAAAVNAQPGIEAKDPVASPDEEIDRQLTEIDPGEAADVKPESELDETIKTETKSAASDEPGQDPAQESDEQQLAADETEAGVAKADEAS